MGGGAVAVGMGCGGVNNLTVEGNGGSSSSTGGAASSSSSASATASSSGTGGAGGTASASSTGTGTMCGSGGASSNGYNNDYCQSDKGVFNVGKPASYPTPGLYKTSNVNSNVLIGRDANGLYAMSSLCTHSCCDLNSFQQGFPYGSLMTYNGQKVIQCNCHGSMFAYDGTVVAGPAFQALQHYHLDLGCDGVLYADTSKPVASTQRLKA